MENVIIATEENSAPIVQEQATEFMNPESNPLNDAPDELLLHLEDIARTNANDDTLSSIGRLIAQICVHACWKEARSRQRAREHNSYANDNKREVKSYGG